MSQPIRVRQDVAEALASGYPVVALESTLVAHGLPRPDNLALALEAEAIVRAEGATPATIGVLDGVPTVGLNEQQLERMATSPDVPIVTERDLAVTVATRGNGATTVSSTAFLAARVGIRLFGTGGLGGVHRDARETWDESPDLHTLSRTSIAVVCSGAKSILDIGATLERLESLNVTVVCYRTRRFPGFYLTDSGHPLDWSVETEEGAAAVMAEQLALGRESSGLVIANPIPAAEQLDPTLHDRVLASGLAEVRQRGIRGSAVTPFLLAYFRAETGGASLRVNMQIIRNNVRLAARIAHAWAERSATVSGDVADGVPAAASYG
jgi:pseudouridylate synthase